MKAAQFAQLREAGHDHFNIGIRRMMAQVDQAFRLRSQFIGARKAGSPVGDGGGVKRRLEQLVLDVHQPVWRQSAIDAAHAVEVSLKRPAQIMLAWKIRPVADPYGQALGAECFAKLDAVDVVANRLRPRVGAQCGERAVLVRV